MTISPNTTKLAKKKIKGQEILLKLDEIADWKVWDFEIMGLTKNTRNILNSLLTKILEKNGISSSLAGFHLCSGLMETLLNAIKGNIKYTVYKNEILSKMDHDQLSPEEKEKLLDIIISTNPLRDAMERYIIPDKIKNIVQKILKLEDRIHTKKESMTPEELAFLEKIRTKIKQYNYKISLKMVLTENEFNFSIRNNVPISQKDQDRINNSRKLHKELNQEGNSSEFFRPEHLDEIESAGLGIALVDEGYYNLGLDPMKLFNVTTSSKATTVYMRYPLESLRQANLS